MINSTSPTFFKLIDEQNDFIIIDKSADINFHDEGKLGEGLFNRIKQELNLAQLYPVHRLDKMTSGLLILAKNKSAAVMFQQLFCAHKIEKYYLAISDKKPKKKQGLIKGDMIKSRRSSWKLLRTMNNPATTQFFSYSLSNHKEGSLRLFLLKPHSGKTHQIRVALASIGSQILGDPIYSSSEADRGYLHAFALNFTFNHQLFQYQLLPEQGQHFNTIEQIPHIINKPWLLPWPRV
jgi:tRNA pseudouridine32 synthase/23S rRNA pseudouridine746 synthase